MQLDSVAARGESNGTLPALEKQGELMQKIVDANGTATEGAAGLNTIKIINASNVRQDEIFRVEECVH